MAQTATQLRSKSENLKRSFSQFIGELKRVNAESVSQISANEKAIEELTAQHELKLAQLRADNDELNALIESNSKFIESVEDILNA